MWWRQGLIHKDCVNTPASRQDIDPPALLIGRRRSITPPWTCLHNNFQRESAPERAAAARF
jgi:hypothetical protein